MGMLEWAENEVKLAIERENQITKDHTKEDAAYATAVYNAAIAGYRAMISSDDGLTGAQWGILREIVDRLMREQPLTPVEDTEDSWNIITEKDHDKSKMYQSKRMPSLFKYVYPDGHVVYHDNSRAHGFDINQNITYSGGVIMPIIDEMFPIKMPYLPPTGSIRVYTESFPFDTKKGDFDTVGVMYAKLPGVPDPIRIWRFFREQDTLVEQPKYGNWVEIKQQEYVDRKAVWVAREGAKNMSKTIVDMNGNPIRKDGG